MILRELPSRPSHTHCTHPAQLDIPSPMRLHSISQHLVLRRYLRLVYRIDKKQQHCKKQPSYSKSIEATRIRAQKLRLKNRLCPNTQHKTLNTHHNPKEIWSALHKFHLGSVILCYRLVGVHCCGLGHVVGLDVFCVYKQFG